MPGQDNPAKEMDLGASLTVFDLEVLYSLEGPLVLLIAPYIWYCGLCVFEVAHLRVDADSVSVFADGGSCRSSITDSAFTESFEVCTSKASPSGER